MKTITELLNWRYATKKFDATKKLTEDDVNTLKEAVNLTASSYGLQPYRVLDVQTPELREKLKAAAFGQSQITDASHLFVFTAFNDLTDQHIDEYIALSAKVKGISEDILKGYGDFMKSVFGPRSSADKHNWAARQAYIAVGNLIDAAASLGIDSCPMEGFDPSAFDEILGLKGTDASSVVVVTLGHRADDDQAQFAPKVRKPLDQVFEVH
ncbi:MAG: NAD(P)H-dependent oxidoreductase [Paludibacter sp.]|jgi:nitroreductase|nr:NAD(P)H-dependent oxidoreductase [Paludibacter sp.]